MGQYQGKTIAFSHKGGFWKTRYSYTPTCYATMDNVMISNNTGVTYSNNLFWEHEVNSTHNNFYGVDNDSSLTLVSNQDPSAVKIYKALSLESNSVEWRGQVSTHVHQNPDNTNELQHGVIKGFITKEGNQYSEIPRSTLNSSSHIDYVCSIENLFVGEADVEGVSTAWDISVNVPDVAILTGNGSIALFVDNTGVAYYLSFANEAWVLVLFTEYSYQISNVFIYSYNSDNTITLAVGPDYALGTLDNAFTGANWSSGVKLFNASDPSVNGDPMRGQYLRLDLVNSQKTPVETYAINVDFENTKLDGSKPAVKKASPAKK